MVVSIELVFSSNGSFATSDKATTMPLATPRVNDVDIAPGGVLIRFLARSCTKVESPA